MATQTQGKKQQKQGKNGSDGHHDGSQPILDQPMGTEVQPFGTLRDLPIALDKEARQQNTEALNQVLADTIILYNLYKKHHWLMRGHTFYQLHLLLDKHAGEQLELVDEVAERIQTLGGIAVGDPRHVAELTQIERPPNGAEEVPVMLARLLKAHEQIIATAREAADQADENSDHGTADLLGSKLIPINELQVWFIAEHLVDTPAVRG